MDCSIVYLYVLLGLYNVMLYVWNLMYIYVNSIIIRIEYLIFNGSLVVNKFVNKIFILDGKVIFILFYLLINYDFFNV